MTPISITQPVPGWVFFADIILPFCPSPCYLFCAYRIFTPRYILIITDIPFFSQFVAAFERVVAGWVRLTVQGPKGSLVTVHYGEKLNPDGTVIYQGTLSPF
jgi:hypothetical protein